MPTLSPPIAMGTPAPDFTLPTADGTSTVTLSELPPSPALMVVFLCVHCPYVKHVEDALGALAAEYADRGVVTVGISSNDVEQYPDDAPEHMVEQAARAGFTFPYLYDATQEVAQAYGAACTPDIFIYDADRTLAYRGEFDPTRPKGDDAATGSTVQAALDAVLAGNDIPLPHPPATGCGIKWKPGNEPRGGMLV